MAITLDGTNGITAPNVYGRNLIINGQGRINQRGYVSGAATVAANQFTLDRWFVVTSGQNLAFTGGVARRVMTAPAGGVSQVVEGSNIVGGSYVLNWDGTATATVNGVARSKGEVFSLTDSSNATVTLTGGTFTDVQLEAGLVPTPFERVSIGDELARCQRYFQVVVQGMAGGAVSTFVAYLNYSPKVTFRTLPTLALSSPAKVDWPNNANYTQSSSDLLSAFSDPDGGIGVVLGNFTGLTTHSQLVLRSDGGRITADAELTS
jgi:hypothetical protein